MSLALLWRYLDQFPLDMHQMVGLEVQVSVSVCWLSVHCDIPSAVLLPH